MRFALPEILWAILALPALAGLAWLAWLRRQRVAARFASRRSMEYLAGNFSPWRARMRWALLLAAAGLLAFAAARPQWGWEDRKIVSRGIDLIVAVDTSNSMLAQDYKPDRLSRAKTLLQDILWQVKGDRIGVIAFAGTAFVKCPLTLDYAMAKAALRTIDINSVPVQGTEIGTAIDTARKAFEMGSAGERVLVLLTDGEDLGGGALAAAERAKAAGIKIYAVGIGTTQGMPIPSADGNYKRDKAGQVVNSRLDFDTLAKIAEMTGGRAVKANPDGTADVGVIMADLAQMQKVSQQDQIFHVYTERFQWFAGAAALLLVIEALETARSRRRPRWPGREAEA